jgi:hypothetical protein
MKKATKKEIKQMVTEMESKYYDLVWLARRTKGDIYMNEDIKQKISDIVETHSEALDLIEDETNWTHGFNSGCLAAFRMIMSSMEVGIEEAKEEFPFLDT